MSMDYKVFIHGEDVYAIWDGGRLAIDSVADYISPDLPVPTDPDDPWNELMVDGVPLRVYTGELPDNHTVLSVHHS